MIAELTQRNMNNNLPKKTYRDTVFEEFYPLYGKFSIEFENMINNAKKSVVMALAGASNTKKQSIAYILIDKEGATGIIKKFSAMLPLIYEPESSEKEWSEKLVKQVKNIITYRNNLIHSSWIFGPSEKKGEDLTVPYSFSHSQSEKKSHFVKISEFDNNQLQEMVEKVVEAKRLFNSLAFSYSSEKFNMIKEFQKSKFLE